jgi:hypothetical protein
MNQRTLRIPGGLQHTGDEQSDAALQEKAREHVDRHPGLQFLADVMRSLHGSHEPMREAQEFFAAFSPKEVMEALRQRPDLRVRVVKAITGSPMALLRRLPADALASQIDLLAIDDLPEAERAVRADGDRALSVHELYLKYLDPLDLATYFPAHAIWKYEGQEEWWKAAPTASTRALMLAELRSVRRHTIMTDSEIIDLVGDETLEKHLPLEVRTAMRKAARRAAAEGRPYSDTDLFAGAGGPRDLVDEMVDHVPWTQLREVIGQVAAMLGLGEHDASVATASATPASPAASRVGPKAAPPAPPPAKTAAPSDRRVPAAKSLPHFGAAKGAATSDDSAPPQPDDDLAFLEEVSEITGHRP